MGEPRFFIRETLDQRDVESFYVNYPHLFSIKLYHGGSFTKFPGRVYNRAVIHYVDMLDVEKFSVHELDGILEQLEYSPKAIRYYHYVVPGGGLDWGLRALGSDEDVRGFAQFVGAFKVIDVYVEHDITNVHTFFCSPSKKVIEEISNEELLAREIVTDKTNTTKTRLLLEWQDGSNEGVGSFRHAVNEIEQEKTVEPEHIDIYNEDPNFDPLFGENCFGVQPTNVSGDTISDEDEGGMNSEESGDDDNGDDSSDSKGDDGDSNDDSDSDFRYEDGDTNDVEVDMRDFRLHTDADVGQHVAIEGFEGLELEMEDVMMDNDRLYADKDDDERDIDALFYVGQVFGKKDEFKSMVRAHAVESRRQIRIRKDDKIRVRVVCEGELEDGSHINGVGSSSSNRDQGEELKHIGGRGKRRDPHVTRCPWLLLLSYQKKTKSWTITRLVSEHKCLQSIKIYACTAGFLSSHLMTSLQENPNIPIRTIKEKFQRKYEVGVSDMKAYRAKMMAKERIHGNFEAQYGLLRDYIEELKRTNPDTTVKLDFERCIDPTSETRQFKRIYVCLGSLKNGFKAIGRDLLGLDGAFLKSAWPDQLLTAVGLDPNNGYYPVAYAVVEAETMDSWEWFLQCLGDDLDMNNRSKFTFMSDRQKGLVQAVEKLFPSAEHRFCVRHITENMRHIFKGKMYRDALWKLAKCTTPAHYEREMNNLKKLNKRAHLWVAKIPPETWSRSHFTGRAISDVLTNNMCECFNSKLVDGRDKPIITLLEFIREYLMRKIVNVLKVIDRSSGLLTPYATKMMESIKKEANRYTVHWNGEEHYQVTGPSGDQCVVNMSANTCACRRWEVTGIPCRHVVASIWVKAAHDPTVGRPETFVNPIYTMDRWKEVYNYKVYPINGISMWPTSHIPIQITAPKYKKQAGRPKKTRKKSAVEKEDGGSRKKAKGKEKVVEVEGQKAKAVRKSRPKGSNTCGTCGQKGHNKRSCMASTAY